MTENNQRDELKKSEKTMGARKPWDLLNQKINEFEFEDEVSPPKSEKSVSNKKEISLSSLALSVFIKNNFNQIMKLTVPIAIALSAFVYAFIPTNYFATLHLYAPEFADTIGTRLSLFTQKIEYASFPVDYKTPVSMLSRRLREDSAKDWVINQIKTNPAIAEKLKGIDLDSVGVDTNYVPNQQLLQLDGYANSPDLSVEITKLYQEYLNVNIQEIEAEQNDKVRKWFELTNISIDEQTNELMKQLGGLSSKTLQRSGIYKLRENLGDTYSQQEYKRETLKVTLADLKKLLTLQNYENVTQAVDSQVQNSLKIYNQILDQRDIISDEKLIESGENIRSLIQRRISEVEFELRTLESGQIQTNQQISQVSSTDNLIRIVSEQESDLRAQLTNLRALKMDLVKFKSQVDMESSIRLATFKVIRAAMPNEKSARPVPAVKYGFAILLSFLLAVTLLFGLSLRKSQS